MSTTVENDAASYTAANSNASDAAMRAYAARQEAVAAFESELEQAAKTDRIGEGVTGRETGRAIAAAHFGQRVHSRDGNLRGCVETMAMLVRLRELADREHPDGACGAWGAVPNELGGALAVEIALARERLVLAII